jgi:hypothetical protein
MNLPYRARGGPRRGFDYIYIIYITYKQKQKTKYPHTSIATPGLNTEAQA